MSVRRLLVVAAVNGLLAAAAGAADWPQWRGPQRDGISQETGLLKEWPATGPRLVWEAKEIGSGYSTPAVVGERIYLISNTGTDDEFALVLSVADGKKIWSTHLGKVGPNQGQQYPGSRSTPTVDGNHVYALGSDGDLACLDAASGNLIWKKNLRSSFGGKPGLWAYAESPLVDGNVLVCTPGGESATLVALEKNTGDVIWKSAVPEGDRAGYASAIVVDAGGVKQYVQFLGKGLVGVDAKTGKSLWRYNQTAKGSMANIPTPVAKAGYIYTSTGQGGAGLVELKGEGSSLSAEQIYFAKDLPRSIGGAVRLGDYLYGTNDRGLMCAEFATGKMKWQNKCVGAGSVCYADGRLYVHGELGDVALVEATPDAFREKGRVTPPDQPTHAKMEKAWAYPIIANGRLYLRDLGRLWCYDVRDPGAAQ
jgi:outer membrane protein assembly factor BamB